MWASLQPVTPAHYLVDSTRHLEKLLDQVQALAAEIGAIEPGGVATGGDAQALFAFWQRHFDRAAPALNAAEIDEAAAQTAKRGEILAEAIQATFKRILADVAAAIAEQAKAGRLSGIVSAREFDSMFTASIAQGENLVAVPCERIPKNNPLWAAVRVEDCPTVHQKPAVILGRAQAAFGGFIEPEPWYELASVAEWTRKVKHYQEALAKAEAEQRAFDREQDRLERDKFLTAEQLQIRALKKQLAELEARAAQPSRASG